MIPSRSLLKYFGVFLAVFGICSAALGQSAAEGPLTFERVVALSVERSPELRRLALAIQSAELSEPLLLAETDTRLESGYSIFDDRSPRAAPAFEGSRSKLEQFDVALVKNTVIGTEARLAWENDRLTNPTPFRVLDPSAESSLTLSVRQNLIRYFLGRPDVARRRAFRSDVEAASQRYKAQLAETAAAAARDFFQVVFALERSTIAAASVESAERLLRSHEEKRRYGLVEESDVLQARVSLDAQRLEKQVADSDLAVARNALRARLKLDQDPVLSDALPSLPDAPATLEEAVAAGLANRSDLRAAKAEWEAAKWRVRTERLDTLPELAVFGSYGAAGLSNNYSRAWDDLGGFDHLVRSAGVDLKMPFTFTRERLQRRSSRLAEATAAAEVERLERLVEREIRDAWTNNALRERSLLDRERLLALEKRKLAAEDANFRRGRSSTDLLVRFRQDIDRAAIDAARARALAADGRLELARATGTLADAVAEGMSR